jgi:hypothetical protein
MTGGPPALSRFELAARELRALGIVMTRLPGEYRVNYRSGITKPGAREARPTTAPHDAEGDAPPYDPGAQSPHARAGLAKKARAQGTEFPKRQRRIPVRVCGFVVCHRDCIAQPSVISQRRLYTLPEKGEGHSGTTRNKV